jgi:Uncharacterised nucleotidyltransferase
MAFKAKRYNHGQQRPTEGSASPDRTHVVRAPTQSRQHRAAKTLLPQPPSPGTLVAERAAALVENLDANQAQGHELGALAAVRWRMIGRVVPRSLLEEERACRIVAQLAPVVLTAARGAYPGRMLLLKGAEIATRYPCGARRYSDIDLLVDDVPAARRALLSAGFREWETLDVAAYHAKPLVLSDLPLKVELHSDPKWPARIARPSRDSLLESAVPSVTKVDGLEAPAPHHHALLVAAHGWAHTPLRTARDLVDTALLTEIAGRDRVESVAAEWRISRVWSTTIAAADWLLGYRESTPLAVRLWARHLLTLREATVAEAHLERWISSFWALPAGAAVTSLTRAAAMDLMPRQGQSWRRKLQQIRGSLSDANAPRSRRGWRPE